LNNGMSHRKGARDRGGGRDIVAGAVGAVLDATVGNAMAGAVVCAAVYGAPICAEVLGSFLSAC